HHNGKPRNATAALENLPRPILGYSGSLSDRIDHEILKKLSEAFAHGSVVMVGPIHGSFGKPPLAGNLHYLGLVDHRELPNYVSAFDVALMPFALNEATRHINPVKTLEYLAAGKPVVSTRVPDVVRFYSEYLYLADSPDDFVATVREALEQPQEERIARGIELARGSSWGTMVEKMAAELGAVTAKAGKV
ncbi:MAG: glycosyltransferase, partial [bacterium]